MTVKKLRFPGERNKIVQRGKQKPIFPITVVLLLITIFILSFHCKHNDDSEVETENNSNFTIMINGQDSQLLSAKTSDGRTIDFYGQRDTNGIPTSLDQVVIKDDDGSELAFFLDQQTRPTKMIADNGTHFNLEWISDKQVVLTVLAPDGETQINTEFNLDESNQYSQNSHTNNQTFLRRIGTTKMDVEFLKDNDFQVPQDSCKEVNTCILYVTQCDIATDAQVWIDVKTNDDPFNSILIKRIYPKRVNTGVYQGVIPFDTSFTVDVSSMCNKLALILDLSCSIGFGTPYLGEAMCVALSVAIASSGIGATVAAPFFAACEKLHLGMVVYCQTLGQSPDGGGPSIASLLCNALPENVDIPLNITLIGVAAGLPSNIYGSSVTVSGEGPYPNLYIDLGSETKISGFELIPSAPQKGQSYNAIGRAFCLEAGSYVRLSIVGTDGYSDQMTRRIKSNEKYGEFSLAVPGAASGVRDVCTFEIELPDGSKVTRTASLVFGG